MSTDTTSKINTAQSATAQPDPKAVAKEIAARKLAYRMADGLVALAEMVRLHPELAEQMKYSGISGINVYVFKRDAVAAFARAGKQAGARIDKKYDDRFAGVNLHFGEHVMVHVYSDRGEVCERVVTGTREVTETVPDPEALAAVPTVEVTRTEEVVEWVCRPLLADEQAPAVQS